MKGVSNDITLKATAKPLAVKDAAPLLGVCPATVYALCAARRLRHLRVGLGRGKIVIPRDAVTEYLSKGTVASNEPHPASLLRTAK